MLLEKIALRNFRNFREQDVFFNNQVNLFIGQNGQGKTNLLEAIELLISGQSFRKPPTEALVNSNLVSEVDKRSSVKGVIKNIHSSYNFEFRIENNKKTFLLNEKKAARSHYQNKFKTFIFSPESLSIIKAGPQERRQLIDEILLSLYPEKNNLLADYQRILKQKNKLLKEIIEDERKDSFKDVLSSLNEVFLPLASELTWLRLSTLRKALPEVQEVFEKVFKYQGVTIGAEYLISSKSAIDWDEIQVYDALKFRLQELAASELASGQALVGPHKHDVRFLYLGEDSRHFCSQGQQRALILAFKVACVRLYHKKRGYYPILLLDDVLSELDEVRRKNLHEVLRDIQAQIFLTTIEQIDLSEFENKTFSTFKILEGTIQKKG